MARILGNRRAHDAKDASGLFVETPAAEVSEPRVELGDGRLAVAAR